MSNARQFAATFIIALASLVAVDVACTKQQGQAVASVAIDVAAQLCVIANQELPETKIGEVCQISVELAKALKHMLAAQRKADAELAASACTSSLRADGGK